MTRTSRERFAVELDGPYDLGATVGFLHSADDPVVRREPDGRVRAAVRTSAGPALVSIVADGGRLELEVLARRSTAVPEALAQGRRLAGLAPEGAETASHHDFLRRARDHVGLAEIAATGEGLRVPQRADVVTALVSAVASQLVTTKFAAQVTGAVLRAHGERIAFDGETWLVPPSAETVAALDPADLRRLQLTRRKAEYVVALCAEVAAGTLDLHALRARPAEEGMSALAARRGVGPTTAAWLLMFGAGHPDAWPPADIGLLRAVERLRGGRRPTERGIVRFAEAFTGVRTHLALALWHHQRVMARATSGGRRSPRPLD